MSEGINSTAILWYLLCNTGSGQSPKTNLTSPLRVADEETMAYRHYDRTCQSHLII